MIFLLCPFVLVIEIDLYLAIVDATKVYKHNYLRIFLRILLAFLLITYDYNFTSTNDEVFTTYVILCCNKSTRLRLLKNELI